MLNSSIQSPVFTVDLPKAEMTVGRWTLAGVFASFFVVEIAWIATLGWFVARLLP